MGSPQAPSARRPSATGRASVRLVHESGCRSPILRPERTGSDGYTVIAQTQTQLADCPIEGEWRLEILDPRGGGSLHRWQLTAFAHR